MPEKNKKPRAPQTPAAVADVGAPDASDISRDNPAHTADNLDAVIPPHNPDAMPIVGIGGSAGAIGALREFFELMPPDSGMAFVVVIHLAPEYESSLPEVLQAKTAMPVVAVQEAVKIEPNCVYVIPPTHHLAMSDGRIQLAPREQPKGKRVAVDLFFRTLADFHDTNAIGIVLSGADGDGAIGVKRIKERGGLTIAQDPSEAEHEGMPRSAIATGMVDWILTIAQMPPRLLEFRANEKRLRLPPEAVAKLKAKNQRRAQEEYSQDEQQRDESVLREVLALLKARTSHDFAHYKRATILRRIGRRLQVNSLLDLPSYLDFLRRHPGEAGALLNDLLISVTNFRDPEAFDALRLALPRLFQNKSVEDQVRVWVVGCATGEEAYSVAMLLHEHSARLEAPPSCLIFATDISEEAIRSARIGSYPETIAADVSAERLRRFFVLENGCYHVRKELRESVLFAAHDLLRDSPFSRLDLVTCRNLLIYLNRDAQRRAFGTFHFSLRDMGLLFLGTSESADDMSAMFSALDKKHRVYARCATPRAFAPPLPTPLPRSFPPASNPLVPDRVLPPTPAAPAAPAWRGASAVQLHHDLLELYAPPSALINADYNILHLSPRAGDYLHFSGGEPSHNLLQVVHPDLRVELSAALFTASQSGEAVRVPDVPIETPKGPRAVGIHVRPAPATEETGGLLLVLFEQRSEPDAAPATADSVTMARRLDEEVQHLKSQLRTTIEQYEAGAEELKASNEELQAINEEARSTAEELETSREELQSVNEELLTVNQELKNKVEELGRANSDLQNLMASTDIATIFLDRTFHIRRFTPRARELFNIIPTDIKRSLFDLTHRLEYSHLEDDAAHVLQTLQPVEREIATRDARWYLMRVLPYRTGGEEIEGVVLTFLDITERKIAEEIGAADLRDTQLLQELGARLSTTDNIPTLYNEIMATAIALMGADAGTVQILDAKTNDLALLATQGFSEEMTTRYARVSAAPDTPRGRALKNNEPLFVDYDEAAAVSEEARAHLAAGYSSVQSTPLTSRSGRAIGLVNTHWREKQHRPTERELRFLDLLARQAADLIEQWQIEQSSRETEEGLRLFLETTSDVIYKMSANWREMLILAGERLIAAPDNARGDWMQTYLPAAEHARVREAIEAAIAGKRLFELEHCVLRADGSEGWMLSRAVPILDESGAILEWFGGATDITARKRTEHALRESEERYRLLIEGIEDYALFLMDAGGRITDWTLGVERVLGYREREFIGQSGAIIFTPEDRARGEYEKEMKTARREGKALDERWHVKKNGERFFAGGVLTARYDEAGELTGFAKILRDMTARKQAEDALKATRDELEARVQERTLELATANVELKHQTSELRRSETERRLLLRRIVAAQEEERHRLSRELHDQIGQQLTALLMRLKSLSAAPQPKEAQAHIAALQSLTENLVTSAHNLAWEMRPAVLDNIGLGAALRQHLDKWRLQNGMEADFLSRGFTGAPRLPEELETTFYRVAQEALANVERHAGANRVSVMLEREGEMVTLIIEDDGRGFVADDKDGAHRAGRLGLLGMRERMELVGGTLEIESSPGGGTTVYARAQWPALEE